MHRCLKSLLKPLLKILFRHGLLSKCNKCSPFFLIVVDQRRSQKRILQRHSRILNFYDVLECDSTFKYGAKDKTWSNCQEPARHSLGPHKSKDELNKIEKNPAPPVTLGPWISGRTNREYDCKKHVNLSWTSCPLFFVRAKFFARPTNCRVWRVTLMAKLGQTN